MNPFRRQSSLREAVPVAGNIGQIATGADGLGPARQWVQGARQQGRGIFESNDPLRLQPFEFRFLAQRRPPSRWVIDLSDNATNTLLRPENYFTIASLEDRLYVPEEYVPLFDDEGWQRE